MNDLDFFLLLGLNNIRSENGGLAPRRDSEGGREREGKGRGKVKVGERGRTADKR